MVFNLKSFRVEDKSIQDMRNELRDNANFGQIQDTMTVEQKDYGNNFLIFEKDNLNPAGTPKTKVGEYQGHNIMSIDPSASPGLPGVDETTIGHEVAHYLLSRHPDIAKRQMISDAQHNGAGGIFNKEIIKTIENLTNGVVVSTTKTVENKASKATQSNVNDFSKSVVPVANRILKFGICY